MPAPTSCSARIRIGPKRIQDIDGTFVVLLPGQPRLRPDVVREHAGGPDRRADVPGRPTGAGVVAPNAACSMPPSPTCSTTTRAVRMCSPGSRQHRRAISLTESRSQSASTAGTSAARRTLGSGENTSSRIESAMPAQPMAMPPRTLIAPATGRQQGAERVGDPVREDLERRVDAAEDAVRDDALDERQLGDALDRLQAVADQLRDEHHQRRQRDRPAGQRRQDADDRRADGAQISAGPRPSRRIARWAKNEPTSEPTPPAEMTTPSRNGSRCSSSIRKIVYRTP